MTSVKKTTTSPRPVRLYDHLPEILVGQLAFVFTTASITQLLIDQNPQVPISGAANFWVTAACSMFWGISYRWNLSKKNFLVVFGLFGTFVGIPAVLEVMGRFVPEVFGWWAPFTLLGHLLGAFAPSASAGAYGFIALLGWLVWLIALVWSRMHLKVVLDDSGLTMIGADGKRVHYDLIGLQTVEDPFDYSELFTLGIGSLTLKTRTGTVLFTLQRVIWLYRIPLLWWVTPKIKRINALMTHHAGTVTIVDAARRADIEGGDQSGVNDDHDDHVNEDGHGEFDHREHDTGDGQTVVK